MKYKTHFTIIDKLTKQAIGTKTADISRIFVVNDMVHATWKSELNDDTFFERSAYVVGVKHDLDHDEIEVTLYGM